MARPQASPAKDEREGTVKIANNMEKVSQARIEEAKEMAWMTNHFWFLNTNLTPGMYSYFILGYDTTLEVLPLKTNSREKKFRMRKTTTTTTPICTLELVTVTDKILISQNLNSPSLHVIKLCPTIAQ